METKTDYTTKALTVAPQITPAMWQMIEAIGPAMHKARLFGVSNAEQAMAIMLKGYELGLSLTASFEFIKVIQGNVSLIPRGHLALIQQSPLCTKLEIVDQQDENGNPSACTVTMERTNGFSYTVTVTMDDARRAGLVKPKSGWEKWPANMLRWLGTGFCADVVFPDLGGGMKRANELGADITSEGDVIDAPTWIITESEKEPEAPNTDTVYTTIEALMEQWEPEEIMTANDGRIPATSEECQAVALKLLDELEAASE